MKTTMDCRTLGESKTNYTNANVRQMRQSDFSETQQSSTTATSTGTYKSSDYDRIERGEASGHKLRTPTTSPGYSTHTKRERKGVTGGQIAAGVIAGASVGVLAGILLAPEKGKDLRKQVRNSATTLGNNITKSFSSTKDKVTTWTNKSADSKTTGTYNNLTSQSSSEINTMSSDPTLGPTTGMNTQRCL
ncbi:YtxH domain-containing protein [Pontibacter sp. H259]|uniref:YtxH domain-containing protein n=1 Tax=Pontibacter sp. H259 TaxID=3133421 RepID=UPI0030C170EE